MRIIAVANQKGGCGKTTTAINLSSCLASKGQKVLLIDFDPQSHATMGLNIDCDPEQNIYHAVSPTQTGRVGLDDVVVPVKENFDIAPSDTLLCAVEQELALVDGREKRLLEAIARLEKPFDFIIVDCPPSIGHLSFNALRAASEAILPIDMSLFSLRGIAKLTDMMVMIKNASGHEVTPRALVTMFDARTRYSQEVLERVREKFEDKVFHTVIRYNIRLRETVDHGLPVGDYDRHAIGQRDYEALSEEVLGGWHKDTVVEIEASPGAEEVLRTAREYLDTMEPVPMSDMDPESETESAESFPYPTRSNYSAMVSAIACGAPLNRADESEEPNN
ncbi:MAG: ParA family protein [Acidobacteria bacterium]|nr:ParA family protein [Acidobacteriota bacterium]